MRQAAFEHGEKGCACESVARIAEILPMAVWIIGSDGSLAYANRAARELPAEVRDAASFDSGERARVLEVSGIGILVIRENGRRSCVAGATPRVSHELLRRLYGLSSAESRVAGAIASGLTPRLAAEALQLSLHTVRTHLKNVFGKTGTSGQNELVVRVATGIAVLRVDGSTFTQLSDS